VTFLLWQDEQCHICQVPWFSESGVSYPTSFKSAAISWTMKVSDFKLGTHLSLLHSRTDTLFVCGDTRVVWGGLLNDPGALMALCYRFCFGCDVPPQRQCFCALWHPRWPPCLLATVHCVRSRGWLRFFSKLMIISVLLALNVTCTSCRPKVSLL